MWSRYASHARDATRVLPFLGITSREEVVDAR
jgi:hypothetical protein